MLDTLLTLIMRPLVKMQMDGKVHRGEPLPS